MTEEQLDLATLDDVAFLAERRRVRSLIECAPGGDESPELTERYRQLNAEFDRRARAAWKTAAKGNGQ
jgi:hypothetical protein